MRNQKRALFINFEVKTREKCHFQKILEEFPSHDFRVIDKPFWSKPILTCYITMWTKFAIKQFISLLTHLGGGGCGARYYPYSFKGLTDLLTLQSSKNRLSFHYFTQLYNYRNQLVLPAAPCLLALWDTPILCCSGHRCTVVVLYRRWLILFCVSKYWHLWWVCFKEGALGLFKCWQSTCLSRDEDRSSAVK